MPPRGNANGISDSPATSRSHAFDRQQGEIVAQLQGLMGEEGAQAIQGLLASAAKPDSGTLRIGVVGSFKPPLTG